MLRLSPLLQDEHEEFLDLDRIRTVPLRFLPDDVQQVHLPLGNVDGIPR